MPRFLSSLFHRCDYPDRFSGNRVNSDTVQAFYGERILYAAVAWRTYSLRTEASLVLQRCLELKCSVMYRSNESDRVRIGPVGEECKIRSILDTQSGFNWTPNPELTGQAIRF